VPVPRGLEAVVRRCLAKDPRDRHPDMGALMWDLAQVANLPADQYMSLSLTASSVQRQVVPPAAKAGVGVALALGLLGSAAFAGLSLTAGLLWWRAQSEVVAPTEPPPTATVASPPEAAPEAPPAPEPEPEPAPPIAPPEPPPAEALKRPSKAPSRGPEAPPPTKDPAGTEPAKTADAPAGYMDVPEDW
jgi:outer membrane biosynthesis protein TonB